ncbi:MAG TPA: hypothetical protein VNJ71_08800 [Gemmatimonadales bacterium]|nr:hypothetical protein [Gemmatimonadales bacterium]
MANPERNGQAVRISWIVLLAFLIGLLGWGYRDLEARKADRSVVEQMAADIREIRNLLLRGLP